MPLEERGMAKIMIPDILQLNTSIYWSYGAAVTGILADSTHCDGAAMHRTLGQVVEAW
jgi:hypothetical protein